MVKVKIYPMKKMPDEWAKPGKFEQMSSLEKAELLNWSISPKNIDKDSSPEIGIIMGCLHKQIDIHGPAVGYQIDCNPIPTKIFGYDPEHGCGVWKDFKSNISPPLPSERIESSKHNQLTMVVSIKGEIKEIPAFRCEVIES